MPRCKKSWLFFLYLIDIFSHLCYTLNKCNLQHSQRGRHMKKHIPAATLAVGIIALCAVLGGCNGEGQTSSAQTTTTSVTTSIAVKSTTTSQTSPQTASSASSITTVTTKETTTSAVTTTKQTAPPKTEPPATVAPVTDPPQTKPPQTEPSPPVMVEPAAAPLTKFLPLSLLML